MLRAIDIYRSNLDLQKRYLDYLQSNNLDQKHKARFIKEIARLSKQSERIHKASNKQRLTCEVKHETLIIESKWQ